MARWDHPIHQVLVNALELAQGQSLVDLGCGVGGTLRCACDAVPGLSVIGIDSNQTALDHARDLLADTDAQLQRADLSGPFTLPIGNVDRIVCHNVLECLVDPALLVNVASQWLRPGGRAVWSHVDFGGIVVNSVDVQMNRKVMAVYADLVQPWMDHADGQLGRKLPGLIRASRLRVDDVSIHTDLALALEGDALARVDEITTALIGSPECGLAESDVLAWRRGLDELDAAGQFLLMEPTVIVTSAL